MREANDGRGRRDETASTGDAVIDDSHGKHGGSLESEGGPQEQQPHAPPPIERRPGQEPRREDGEAHDDTAPRR